jgi:hypothetical protein
MISIRAIYKIPEVKCVFIIVDALDLLYDYLKESQESKKRKEYSEHIVQYKHHKDPKDTQQWKLKIMPVDDFLSAIELNNSREQVLPNQSSQNPEKLELLCINLIKNLPDPSDWKFKTPKVLCDIPYEDILEIFI